MRVRMATLAAWGLALALTAGASAQSDKGDKDKSGKDSSQKPSQSQSQGKAESICGELAGVSVVGETVIDSSTGRGVVAEFTYLTILGSPGHSKGGSDSHSGQDHKDHAGSSGRRRVYHIAVGPETQVCDKSEGDKSPGGDHANQSSREKTRAAMEKLQLGDRVEVEFTPMMAKSGSGDHDANASSNASRHGRHRIVRGMAKSIAILATPDQSSGSDKDKDKDKDKSTDKDKGGHASSDSGSSK